MQFAIDSIRMQRLRPPMFCQRPSVENLLKENSASPIMTSQFANKKLRRNKSTWKGGVIMQVEIKIDTSCTVPKVIIMTNEMTEEVNQLARKLSDHNLQIISGSRDGKTKILEPDDLFHIYAATGKVFAVTKDGEYQLRLRLYEAEERLNPTQFVRISNSEIINLKKVKNFDLSFTGTISVEMTNGTTSYVSRRYVAKIKKMLGL